MTNAMMLPIAAEMDRVGFDAIDLIGGAVWDVCVRFLREDPWERIRHVRKLITHTPLNAWVRGQSLWTFQVFPNDVVQLAIERLQSSGIRQISLYDQFNDLRNVEVCVAKARSIGLGVRGALVFSHSPVHTDQYYAGKAAEYSRLGVDEIILKDPSGMLDVDRIRTIVPALRAAIGAVPINIHSHCMSGRAPDVLMQAVESGADKLHTAVSPLAYGASHPPTEWIHDRLCDRGYDMRLDRKALDRVAAYFRYVCHRWDKPVGQPAPADPLLGEHQMPGGMISNLRTQLRESGIEHRLDEILVEAAQVRKDMGYAPVVSPTAQFMLTQAVLNVLQGERYKTIPDELRKYVLGYYGTPPAPVAQELLDRAVRKGDKFVSGRAGDLVAPALDSLRRARGPFASDDDLLNAAFYGDEILAPMIAARNCVDYTPFYRNCSAMADLVFEVLRRTDIASARIHKKGGVDMRFANEPR